MRPTPQKTKFGRKATDDDEYTEDMDEEMDLRTILICIFPISLKCSTISLTLPDFFKLKREKLRGVREKPFFSRGKA